VQQEQRALRLPASTQTGMHHKTVVAAVHACCLCVMLSRLVLGPWLLRHCASVCRVQVLTRPLSARGEEAIPEVIDTMQVSLTLWVLVMPDQLYCASCGPLRTPSSMLPARVCSSN
jgi:hypothetical protein